MAESTASHVFLLWFVHHFDDDEDDEMLIGVYSTEERAKAAIERLRGQRGFVDHPEWFEIAEYELDRDHWTEGYIVD